MKKLTTFVVVLCSVGVGVCHAQYHTNTITTPDDFVLNFSVDGSPQTSPAIELQAGVTNILDIQTFPDHPVEVVTADTFGFYDGANPQVVYDQPITVTTPSSGFPAVLYYVCAIHGFYGEIHFSALGSPPPPNTILEIRVGTNIVMTSTGTNTTWLLVPEFSSNLVSGTWAPVPSFTNNFANGTNTTVFDRLDPICGPNVFLRLRLQQN
jgi:hypothetical protein